MCMVVEHLLYETFANVVHHELICVEHLDLLVIEFIKRVVCAPLGALWVVHAQLVVYHEFHVPLCILSCREQLTINPLMFEACPSLHRSKIHDRSDRGEW